MTFGHGLFPMTKDNGCSKYAGLSYYTPRLYDPKRAYPWSTDVTRPGISSNKKQVVEATSNRPDFLQRIVYPLDKASNYQSTPGQVQGGLVFRPSQFLYMADSSLGVGGMSAGRKDFKNKHQGNASAHSHNVGKIVKAKVDYVCDSENVVSVPISNFLRKDVDGRLLRSVGHKTYYCSFLSLGSSCQIKGMNDTPMDVIHNEGLDLSLTLGHNYEEKREIFVSDRANGPVEHASGMAVADKKAIADNKATLDYPHCAHLSRATSQTNTAKPNAHQNNISVHVICNGRHNDEAMLDNHKFAQSSGATSWVGLVEPNAQPSLKSNLIPGDNAKEQKARKEKKPKTASGPHPNLYPSSIHSLLSTRIFDGALVKYISQSRDLILHGVIKGSKILCSCNECNNSEYIGACKFERHAGGKTKKPNNHIYFENGKTIYEVFHELRGISEDKLFDAIQKIAGSAVNQQNFHIWKGDSYLGVLPDAPSPK